MAIWLATGPPGMSCSSAASTVVAGLKPSKFWITPWLTSTTANDEGERQEDPDRAADEVDPEVADGRWSGAARSRGSSAAIVAMPAAADTKFCTASPTIWVRWLIVASPP